MKYLVNASLMKQCDQYTIQELGLPSMVLMERAALCLVEELRSHHYDLSCPLILCGSGNNGGDGFAIARLLAESGSLVQTVFAGKESSLTKECSRQKEICRKLGISILSAEEFLKKKSAYSVIVDALFGIGLSREIQGIYAELIRWANRQETIRVAVDIPSGVSANSGQLLGQAFHADLTVTFGCLKTGQVLYPGAEYCGELICREMGIRYESLAPGNHTYIYEKKDLRRIPPRSPQAHKGSCGKVLLIAGSAEMCGAAILAGRAACRSGAGLVRIFTPECNRAILHTVIPEALVTSWEKEEELPQALEQSIRWADVIGIGPGLGTSQSAEAMVKRVLQEIKKPLVLDADALNLLASHPKWHWIEEGCTVRIITPHMGEMSRLTGKSIPELAENRMEIARSCAADHKGLICVLKDARTVVSDGDRIYLNTSGTAGMAGGGSGDVLTGLLCGLLGQMSEFPAADSLSHEQQAGEAASLGKVQQTVGTDVPGCLQNPMEIVCLAVYLHGLAGEWAAREKGIHGMLAMDLAEAIGEVLKISE